MPQVQIPSTIGLTLHELGRPTTPFSTWAGLLYLLLRISYYSSDLLQWLGEAFIRNVGPNPGDLIQLNSAGKINSRFVDPNLNLNFTITSVTDSKSQTGTGPALREINFVTTESSGALNILMRSVRRDVS